MARIPDSELERLKTDVSLLRLIEASGLTFKKQGKDYAAHCPFHEDSTASLIVTPTKNLYHCFGCNAAGGPIDWVMRTRHISFRRAVEELRGELGHTSPLAAAPLAVAPAADTSDSSNDQALLHQVLDYYHETLKASPEALAYLDTRGLNHPELISRFRLGYANRTLAYHLPVKQLKAGAEIRGRLQALGVLRDSGHEHFNGSLVVPVIDPSGTVQEIYGRKIRDNLRPGTAYHLYLPGPHAGVWNEDGLASADGEVIVCEALIDAMTFWVHGYHNVTACYGVNGFTDELQTCLQGHGIQRVLIAFDRDEAGNAAAAKLAERLLQAGISCFRVLFPKGMDANEYALKVTPARQSLGLLLRQAEWLGTGQAPQLTSAVREALRDVAPAASPAQNPAAKEKPSPAPPAIHESAVATPSPLAAAVASPVPPPPSAQLPHQIHGDDLLLTLSEREWRIRGWQKPLNPETLKVNVRVSHGERFHVDTLDLYHARARAAFIKQAALELGAAVDTVKYDLGRVLRTVETVQAEHVSNPQTGRDKAPILSEAEHADAVALLKSPDLMARILADFAALGVVGEESNKLVGYLAAVSRLLDRPLALVIQSSSAAGKSSLMDAVLDLMPDEAQLRYSAMSGQSLFYMGATNLKHKILAIAEEEGAQQASYALKLLQSDGQVSMASTGKDAHSGQLVTQEYRVEGPVMLFLTTTAIDIDEELMNRCLVLSVNESREQTRAIHAVQRQRETLDGLLARSEREAILAVHRNAQRLLRPLAVVNPYAGQLSFRDDQTRNRRDHVKYLTLIRSIALLQQYQRDVKTVHHAGQTLTYIEVEPADIELANRLAHEVLGRTLDELPPQTRKLLNQVQGWVKTECARESMPQSEYRFTRKTLRDACGWGDTQLKIHLARLVELEYLLVHRRGTSFDYELVYQGEGDGGGRFMLGLCAPAACSAEGKPAYDGERSGLEDHRSVSGRPVVGSGSGAGRPPENNHQAPSAKALSPAPAVAAAETHLTPSPSVRAHRSRSADSASPLAAHA